MLEVFASEHFSRRAKKAGFAVLDQAAFSGTNFVLNILLVRWLPPAEYGAFAVAYSVFLLLAAFHSAVLTEPMLMFGAGKYAEHFRKYLGFLLYGHWRLTAAIGLILAASAGVFWGLGSSPLAQTFFGLAMAAPFILLVWFLRRAFYVRFQPHWAAMGSALYLLLMTVGTYGLYQKNWLSSFTVLMVMGIVSMLVGLLLVVFLSPHRPVVGADPALGTVARDHWKYGKWLLVTSGAYWLHSDAILPMIAMSAGLAAAGVFRAYENLLLPLFHFLSSLSTLITPMASARFVQQGSQSLQRITFGFTILAVAASGVYGLLVYLFREPLVDLLLGPRYLGYTELLKLWLLGPMILALGQGAQIAVRVAQRTDFVFHSYAVGSVAALGGFVLLIPPFGLWGAVWARVLSFVALTAVITISWRRVQVEDGLLKGLVGK